MVTPSHLRFERMAPPPRSAELVAVLFALNMGSFRGVSWWATPRASLEPVSRALKLAKRHPRDLLDVYYRKRPWTEPVPHVGRLRQAIDELARQPRHNNQTIALARKTAAAEEVCVVQVSRTGGRDVAVNYAGKICAWLGKNAGIKTVLVVSAGSKKGGRSSEEAAIAGALAQRKISVRAFSGGINQQLVVLSRAHTLFVHTGDMSTLAAFVAPREVHVTTHAPAFSKVVRAAAWVRAQSAPGLACPRVVMHDAPGAYTLHATIALRSYRLCRALVVLLSPPGKRRLIAAQYVPSPHAGSGGVAVACSDDCDMRRWMCANFDAFCVFVLSRAITVADAHASLGADASRALLIGSSGARNFVGRARVEIAAHEALVPLSPIPSAAEIVDAAQRALAQGAPPPVSAPRSTAPSVFWVVGAHGNAHHAYASWLQMCSIPAVLAFGACPSASSAPKFLRGVIYVTTLARKLSPAGEKRARTHLTVFAQVFPVMMTVHDADVRCDAHVLSRFVGVDPVLALPLRRRLELRHKHMGARPTVPTRITPRFLTPLLSTRIYSRTNRFKNPRYLLDGVSAACDWAIVDGGVTVAKTARSNPRASPRTVFVHANQPERNLAVALNAIEIGATRRLAPAPTVVFAGSDMTFPRQTDTQPRWAKRKLPRAIVQRLRSHLERGLIARLYVENLDVAKFHPRAAPIPLGVNPLEGNVALGPLVDLGACFPLHDRPYAFTNFNRIAKRANASISRLGEQWRERKTVAELSRTAWARTYIHHADAGGLPHAAYLALLAQCRFTVCVHGGGLDPCPKVWEALAVGTIPIVRRSHVTPAFEGLPVVVVDKWTAHTMSTKNLRAWAQKLAPMLEGTGRLAALDRLTLSAWMKRMES